MTIDKPQVWGDIWQIVINMFTLQWMFRTIGCASYQQCTNNKNVIVKPTGPWWSSWPRNRQEQQPLEGSSCSGAELCHSAKLSSSWCNHCGPVHSLRPVPDSHEEWDEGERGMPSRCAHVNFSYHNMRAYSYHMGTNNPSYKNSDVSFDSILAAPPSKTGKTWFKNNQPRGLPNQIKF